MNAIDYWYKKYMALKETERIPKPELTWEDVRRIVVLSEDVFEEGNNLSEQEFYEEVLTRFKQLKEGKK